MALRLLVALAACLWLVVALRAASEEATPSPTAPQQPEQSDTKQVPPEAYKPIPMGPQPKPKPPPAPPGVAVPIADANIPEDLKQWATMMSKFKNEPDLKPEEVPWDVGWDFGEEAFKRCKQQVPEDRGKFTLPENKQFRGLCSRFQDIVEETFDEQGQLLLSAFENQHSASAAVASKQSYHYLGAQMMDVHIDWMAKRIRSGKKLQDKRNRDEFIQRFFKFYAEVMKEVDRPGTGNILTGASQFDMPDVDHMREEYLANHPEEREQAPPLWEPKKEAAASTSKQQRN